MLLKPAPVCLCTAVGTGPSTAHVNTVFTMHLISLWKSTYKKTLNYYNGGPYRHVFELLTDAALERCCFFFSSKATITCRWNLCTTSTKQKQQKLFLRKSLQSVEWKRIESKIDLNQNKKIMTGGEKNRFCSFNFQGGKKIHFQSQELKKAIYSYSWTKKKKARKRLVRCLKTISIAECLTCHCPLFISAKKF